MALRLGQRHEGGRYRVTIPARVYAYWTFVVVAAQPLAEKFSVSGRERAPSVASVRAVSLFAVMT